MRWNPATALVLSAFCLSGCLVTPAAGEGGQRPKDFGKRWVRSRPFMTTALVLMANTFDPKEYRAAGMTQLLAWKSGGDRDPIFEKAAAAGLPWHQYIMKSRRRHRKNLKLSDRYKVPLSDKEKAEAHRLHDNFPGCEGWIVWDEPRRPAFKTMAAGMDWFRKTFPDKLVYSILYSAGASPGKYYASPKDPKTGKYTKPPVRYTQKEYLQEYLRICKPDVLVSDPYPFINVEMCDPHAWIGTRFFRTLANVRREAQNVGIPYWSFIQVFSIPGSKYSYLPSESDVRMQVYSSLAYGFKGLLYFLYQTPTWKHAILDENGNEGRMYKTVAKLNKEVGHLGKALRFLTSTDVRYAPGRHYCPRPIPNGEYLKNLIPLGAREFEPAAGTAYQIKGFRAHGISIARNGLIGFFRDDDGGKYFMAVNLLHNRGALAAEMEARVTVTFEPSVASVWRLSRTTGHVEEVKVKKGSLELILPGGTGDLFKLGDGAFAGLENRSSKSEIRNKHEILNLKSKTTDPEQWPRDGALVRWRATAAFHY